MMYYYNKGTDERQEQLIVETEADIAKLPTSTSTGNKAASVGDAFQKINMGSIALCVETGDVYMLTTNNQWTKVGAT